MLLACFSHAPLALSMFLACSWHAWRILCVCVSTSVPKSTYPNLPQVYMVYILEKLPKPHYNHQLATTTLNHFTPP